MYTVRVQSIEAFQHEQSVILLTVPLSNSIIDKLGGRTEIDKTTSVTEKRQLQLRPTAEYKNMVDRDKELTSMLEDENKPKIRAGNKDAKRKRLWLGEVVTIRRVDEDGFVPANCEWKVERRKLRRKLLQELVNRCPIPCVIDYVYENTGAAIWIEDLQLKAQPAPAFYTIVPVVFRSPEDVKSDPKYDGDTAFILCNVPNAAKDGTTPVTEQMIQEWLLVAINEVDKKAIKIREDILKIEGELAEVEKLIRKIPKMVLNDINGKPLDQAAADAERQIMYDMYGQAKYKIETRIKNRHLDLNRQMEIRRDVGMDLEIISTDKNTHTSTWRVLFKRYDDAKDIEDSLATKDDWISIRLAAPLEYANPPVGPWAGRGAVPDGSKEYLPDYREVVVNMSGVRIKRVPHGVGSWKTLDRDSSSYSSELFSYYTGEFRRGQKHGSGIEIDDVGIYAGEFEFGKRIGSGRLDMANGLCVIGHFGDTELFPSRKSGDFENPYLGGELDGEHFEILFPDGGLYKGQMTMGTVTGIGEYESAFGERLIGQFQDGMLHGEGVYVNTAGEEYSGRWIHGDLHGLGTYKNKYGDSYKGSFKYTMKHGRGHMKFKALGEYKGFWISDTKSGKAEMDYLPRVDASNTQPEITDAEIRSGHEFKYRYQGYFVADRIMNGGIQLNTKMQVPYSVSKRDEKGKKSINKFEEKVLSSIKKMNRKKVKMMDLEHHMRHEIELKKMRIYKQQKHYTKKSMYDEDYEGLDHHELIQRRNARGAALERLTDQHLTSSRALIPRLALKDAEPTIYLTQALKKIEKHRENPINVNDDAEVDKAILQGLAISNFEEAVERQRFLKYDNIWGRAEKAFAEKRKKAAEEAKIAESNA